MYFCIHNTATKDILTWATTEFSGHKFVPAFLALFAIELTEISLMVLTCRWNSETDEKFRS